MVVLLLHLFTVAGIFPFINPAIYFSPLTVGILDESLLPIGNGTSLGNTDSVTLCVILVGKVYIHPYLFCFYASTAVIQIPAIG